MPIQCWADLDACDQGDWNVHLLGAAQPLVPIEAILTVTKDKCYQDDDDQTSFREDAHLRGDDPDNNRSRGVRHT